MSEVFDGTPCIVSITISDQEQRQVTMHVAGLDMHIVEDAIRGALGAIESEHEPAKPKKARKLRRTKAEMQAAAETEAS
jgi:hypothetical protein